MERREYFLFLPASHFQQIILKKKLLKYSCNHQAWEVLQNMEPRKGINS